MLDLITYALLKKKIEEAATGISNIRYENGSLVFELADGTTTSTPIDFPGADVPTFQYEPEENLLKISYSDGTVLQIPTWNEERIAVQEARTATLETTVSSLENSVGRLENLGLFVKDGKLHIQYTQGDDTK